MPKKSPRIRKVICFNFVKSYVAKKKLKMYGYFIHINQFKKDYSLK